MLNPKLFLFALVSLSLLTACSNKNILLDKAKEQGIASVVDEAFSTVSKTLNLSYWLANMESNRVHSVRHGKGVNIQISNLSDKVKIYLEPEGETAGIKQRLFHNNFIKPGSYALYTSIGTKKHIITIARHARYDYFELAKLTDSKADKGLGRVRITFLPSDAKIVIYGTPHKYRDGLRLPEGQYQVKASKPGYETQSKLLTVKENKLTETAFELIAIQSIKKEVHENEQPRLYDGGHSSIAKTPKRAEIADQKENAAEHELAEEITVVGRLGELVITPVVDGVLFRLTNKDNEHIGYEEGSAYAPGTYSVTAIDIQLAKALETKQVTIEALGLSRLHFDILENASPVKSLASIEFLRRVSHREKAVLILTSVSRPEDSYRFTKRLRKRKEQFDIELPKGLYTAFLEADGKQFKLGEINLLPDSKNMFRFELK